MATIPVGAVKPYRRVRTEHFPEGESQSFITGDLLTWSSTTANRVIKATNNVTTNHVGFAAEAATGTAGTKVAVYVADDLGEFIGNVSTAVAADDTSDVTNVGQVYGLVADTTNSCWRVDLGEVTATHKIVQIVKLADAAGDTNGRVVFHFIKTANVDMNRQPF